MRHNLDCLSKVVAAALLFDDVKIHLACGDVVLASEADREVALIVTEIKIYLGACNEVRQERQ